MYTLDLEQCESWLLVTAHGVLDEVTDRAIDEQVTAECQRRSLSAALIDIGAMTGRLGLTANFEAGASFGARVQQVVRRVAIVDLAEHADHSGMFEDAAVNRGANVRFFSTVEAAEAWLRGR